MGAHNGWRICGELTPTSQKVTGSRSARTHCEPAKCACYLENQLGAATSPVPANGPTLRQKVGLPESYAVCDDITWSDSARLRAWSLALRSDFFLMRQGG